MEFGESWSQPASNQLAYNGIWLLPLSSTQLCKTHLHKTPFCLKDKHAIKVLRKQENYGAKKLFEVFVNKD